MHRAVSLTVPCGVAITVLTLAMAPAKLAGQQDSATRLGATVDLARGPHADHAELHRPQPRDAAIEIIAVEMIRPLNRDPEALCQVARLALVAGLLSQHDDDQRAWFRRAERYARTARELRPRDPDAAFAVAAAIGVMTRHQPLRERIVAAKRVLALTDTILSRNPDHPGGLHLRGQLTTAAMKLNPMTRFLAERLIGGAMLRQASWERAESDFRKAIAAEPDNPAHRLELADLLHHTGRTEEARAQLRHILAMPGNDTFTEYHRQQAAMLLGEMD